MTGTVPPTDLKWQDPAMLLEDDADGDEFSVGDGPRYKPKRMLPKRPKAPPQAKPDAQDTRRPEDRR